ncbi:hypothetical protein BG011_008019 [Mortierella polycephala]|uniref:Uncharacterized protein n=1 Tax=Mortierella polycephala TaxID=41804 RepID=A0A9P6Q9T6_9FUNG|nr:hypothetical protein BG011_008019 [Mortierella polycephala]
MDEDAPRHKPVRGRAVSWDIRSVREATLQKLLDAIMDLSHAHGQNSEDQKYPSNWFLERVILRGEMAYQSRLYPLLPYLQRLKELRLENISQPMVDLDVILLSCRQLSRLHLETAEPASWERWEQRKRVQLRWRSETRTPLTLTSLTIRRLSFGHSTIECLLNDCSQLRNLEILLPNRWSSLSTMPTTNQSVIPGDDSNRDVVSQFSIFRIVTSACPFLNHLGVASMDDTMTGYDAEVFVESFPLVQSAAMLGKDIIDYRVNEILFPSIFSNRLSSLEITSCFKNMPLYMTYDLDSVVHRILCNTPTLLHLKAPQILYYGEYFDMCGDLDTNGFYRPMLCINRQPAKRGLQLRFRPLFPRIQKQLWACRGLQTLELAVHGKGGDVRSSECSRIMFAYLVKVCPDLREIVLRRSSVNLNLEGGLCLLSKLRHLRKLEIHTDVISKLERKDLFWLSAKRVLEKKESSTQEFSRQMALEELRREAAEEDKHWERNISSASSFRQSTASSVEPEIDNTMSDRYKTLMPDDIVTMTKFSSVVKVLEERMADDRMCWPQLERFGLCAERPGGIHLSTEQIERTIKNVRSDMEIVVEAPLLQP